MMLPLKTKSAAARLGATVEQLLACIYHGKLAPPGKDESGDYIWFDSDIERARAALAVDRRRKRPIEQAPV